MRRLPRILLVVIPVVGLGLVFVEYLHTVRWDGRHDVRLVVNSPEGKTIQKVEFTSVQRDDEARAILDSPGGYYWDAWRIATVADGEYDCFIRCGGTDTGLGIRSRRWRDRYLVV